jgi:hypothetical protein
LRKQVEKKRKEGRERGDKQVVRSKMKRREAMPEGCVGERSVPERKHRRREAIKEHDVEKEVSREDTGEGSSRVVENEVRSPWIMRDGVESEEDEVQSSSNK